jgi:hypothetical protein
MGIRKIQIFIAFYGYNAEVSIRIFQEECWVKIPGILICLCYSVCLLSRLVEAGETIAQTHQNKREDVLYKVR